MASFFDNLSDKLNTVGKGIADKAKEVSDLTKINSQIREEEKKIQAAYAAIGQKYHEANKENPDPEYVELFSGIAASKSLLAQYQLDLQKIKGLCTCENCGEEIDVNAAFCPFCGTKNEYLAKKAAFEAEQAAKNAPKVCPNCGASVKEDAVFCPECGSRVEVPEEKATESSEEKEEA